MWPYWSEVMWYGCRMMYVHGVTVMSTLQLITISQLYYGWKTRCLTYAKIWVTRMPPESIIRVTRRKTVLIRSHNWHEDLTIIQLYRLYHPKLGKIVAVNQGTKRTYIDGGTRARPHEGKVFRVLSSNRKRVYRKGWKRKLCFKLRKLVFTVRGSLCYAKVAQLIQFLFGWGRVTRVRPNTNSRKCQDVRK